MREDFVHYLWKFQKFNKLNLRTTSGQELEVITVGQHNHHAGPDFQHATVQIDGIKWAGSVEIHVNSSDWEAHKHTGDEKYDNVILHVVWSHNREIVNKWGDPLPTLELKNICPQQSTHSYMTLMASTSEILCSGSFATVSEITKLQMLDSAATRRIERKGAVVLNKLQEVGGDWEKVALQWLTIHFGFKLNNEVFEELSRVLPFTEILKQRHNPTIVEAMVYGMAGFLDIPVDNYSEELKQHFDFFEEKLKLKGSKMLKSQWKFMRTRPGNFPTVRLAQLSSIIASQQGFFQRVLSVKSLQEVKAVFQFESNQYWQKHYDFGKERKKPGLQMGAKSIEVLAVNSIVPILGAYGKYSGNYRFFEQALELLQSIKAEQNHITQKWEKVGLNIQTILDSQGAIEQYNEYCRKSQCLNCNVGVSLMK